MSERDRVCGLLLDEMSLKTGLSYDKSKDLVVGFENFGCLGSSKNPANSALVFMVQGLGSKWKQPIGYFLSHNTTPAAVLKSLVTNTVEKLMSIGLRVGVVVCDQGCTNQQMFRLFGVSIDNPYSYICGMQIVFMYDTPHLLKSIRNNLVKHDFVIDHRTVRWKYIVSFCESDAKRHIRMAPRLTKTHTDQSPFSSMRVNLAAQIFSHTVAAGLCCYIDLGIITDAEAVHTADFLKLVDGLFDVFNSRTMADKKLLRRPITDHSCHWQHLDKCADEFRQLSVVGCRSPVLCIAGWQLNMNALKLLWSKLKSEHKFDFLYASRLTQDSLENLFSIIRAKGHKVVTETILTLSTSSPHSGM